MAMLGRCNRCREGADLIYANKVLGHGGKPWCIECLQNVYPDAAAQVPAAMRAAQAFIDKSRQQ